MARHLGLACALAALHTGCQRQPDDGAEDWTSRATAIEADPQRDGDPTAGYDALVNGAYVTCGLPRETYDTLIGPAPEIQRLEGRSEASADIVYAMTAVTAPSGVEVVGANCLLCHASYLDRELVIGLGASEDFTSDQSAAVALSVAFVDPEDDAARAEWQRWADRMLAVAPYTLMNTVGANPADNLAAALFAHRDPQTLAWSNEPLMTPPAIDPVPVDVPAWWLMRKKNAMFYTASGRGDHARIMMSASALCTDSVAEAQSIDTMFPDVRAYILSLQPPLYPHDIDAALAEEGRVAFERACSACHGTYGEGESYPNLLLPADEVGTDPWLSQAAGQFAGPYVEWFNSSFYGEIARFQTTDGYIAPPLDGVWATAPYFHNGSVPTLAAVLDPGSRPTYWRRSGPSYELEYDIENGGWLVETLDHGKDSELDAYERARIVDTTLVGYGNGGHTYGEALTDEERTAVLEYLRTL